MKCENSTKCENYWYETMEKIGLKTSFRNIGISDSSDIDYLIKCIDQNRLSNNPIKLNATELRDILNTL